MRQLGDFETEISKFRTKHRFVIRHCLEYTDDHAQTGLHIPVQPKTKWFNTAINMNSKRHLTVMYDQD